MAPFLTCVDCGASSETARFYNRINKRCAECHKERVKRNRRANPDYYRAFEAMRYVRDYEKRRALMAGYAATDAGKEAARRGRQRYIANNPEKRKAHIALGNALRDGRVVRKCECEGCGFPSPKLHGHHDDYAKPLEVRWLCIPCHNIAHHGDRAIAALAKEPRA